MSTLYDIYHFIQLHSCWIVLVYLSIEKIVNPFSVHPFDANIVTKLGFSALIRI